MKQVDMKRIFLLMGLSFIMGCGSEDSDPFSFESSSSSEKYTYHYSENINGFKCDTGKRSFDSLEAYCRALQQGQENDFCAEDIRKRVFQERCPGVWRT